jgi:hypothetical protein
LTADRRVPEAVSAAGFEYFLEVVVACDEVLDGAGQHLSARQKVEAGLHYAENDALPDWYLSWTLLSDPVTGRHQNDRTAL